MIGKARHRAFFVTGTDTGVGKTVVSVLLMRALRDAGLTVLGMKPVAAGCEQGPEGLRNEDVEALRAAASFPVERELMNPYAFLPPVSPHLAAAAAGVRVDLDLLRSRLDELERRCDIVLVEGAGGWYAPVSEAQTMADLARALGLPVVLVVGLRLGCLNHALLTAEAIVAGGSKLLGWVGNRIDPRMALAEENTATLAGRLPCPLLGVVPHLGVDARQADVRLDLSPWLLDAEGGIAVMSNRDWLERSRAAVWHPCTQMKRHERLPLVPLARGQGVWLYDFEGRRYLDAVSSWWVNLFGHCNPAINAALIDQLGRLEHTMLAGFTHAPVVELSERLAARTGGRLGHAFYGSDGASATEIALKMSFHYWRNSGRPDKTGYVSLANGYHGETIGALAVTDVALFRDTYAPLLRATARMPSPDARLAEPGESAEAYALRCAAALDRYLAEHHETTAALILEPLVQGAAGMAMYDPAYLRAARESCDRHRVHLIADEIAVGFGRTGSFFACEQAGIWPDLMCLSKGLSGGYLPLSAVLATGEIYSAFYDDDLTRGFLHSHSYTGNPLACRAAVAMLDLFEARDVLADNRALAEYVDALAEPIRALSHVRQFRRHGMIWAFDVAGAPADFSQRLFAAALERELLLRPLGATVYWMPPYVIGRDEAAHMVEATLGALRQVMS